LQIFTEDLAEVEALPRPRVLDFLLRSHASVVIPYLEHVVHVWVDTNPLFHNALVHQYREKAMSEGPAAAEHTRRKLLEFLKKSPHYTADTVLGHFPTDSLLEERAIILGKLGKHEQALAIYVRALGDISKSVEYAQKVYESNTPGCQSVIATHHFCNKLT
jgi:tetratricopeptide (TPR) repeat protein